VLHALLLLAHALHACQATSLPLLVPHALLAIPTALCVVMPPLVLFAKKDTILVLPPLVPALLALVTVLPAVLTTLNVRAACQAMPLLLMPVLTPVPSLAVVFALLPVKVPATHARTDTSLLDPTQLLRVLPVLTVVPNAPVLPPALSAPTKLISYPVMPKPA